MNYYHVFIISLWILGTRAKDIKIGTACVITDKDGDFDDEEYTLQIAKATKDVDVSALKTSYDYTGGKLSVTMPSSGESGEGYILATTSSTSVDISIDESFNDNFEENIQIHIDDNYPLVRTLAFSCDGEPAVPYTLQIDIEDTNNHPPTFLENSYKLQLSKMITPDVDITTVNNQALIIVEDIDFSNNELELTIDDDRFKVTAEPTEGDRKFNVKIEATETVNITEPITITIVANDGDFDSDPAVLTITAPNLIGDCTIEDSGLLEYGFFQYSIQDVQDNFNLTFDITGPLDIQSADKNDTSAEFINIELNAEKTQLVFSLSDDFKEKFEQTIVSEERQSKITIYKSATLTCGVSKQGFTFGLAVEDTNNHIPTFVKESIVYNLPKTLMPKVDLTSAGEHLLVEDLDFSNTDITFTADAPFIMETVVEDTVGNKRRYRGILRVPSYYTIEGDSLEVKIVATDNGNPVSSVNGTITIQVD